MGWISLSVTYKTGNMEFTNEFDLPKYMCKVIS